MLGRHARDDVHRELIERIALWKTSQRAGDVCRRAGADEPFVQRVLDPVRRGGGMPRSQTPSRAIHDQQKYQQREERALDRRDQ
jgi:hypothetical protein